MQSRNTPLLRTAAGALLVAALAACDAPTHVQDRATAGGPSLLITPACAGTGGTTHIGGTVTTAQTWTRAASPHRVTGQVYVTGAGRITIAPGAVVCFEPWADLTAQEGGRLSIRGRDTAQVVLTARDPIRGWGGIWLFGTPAGPSYVTNARVEHVGLESTAIYASDGHPVYVDSAVIRQSGQAVALYSLNSRLSRSRVDTTTNRWMPAVQLSANARFESMVVRGAAGNGVVVGGNGVLLSGGRIEGSGGLGLQVSSESPLSAYSKAVRVVGGRTYGVALGAAALARLYPTPALQDSVRGNAVDTLVIFGEPFRGTVTLGPSMPVRAVNDPIVVDSAGVLTLLPGTRIVFDDDTRVEMRNGGRLSSRGTPASPVLLTASDPAYGWGGLLFQGTRTSLNYVTNTRIEHVGRHSAAVTAYDGHRVIVDSSVIRMSGAGASLHSLNSRLSRTRVDTTTNSNLPAVELGSNARIESTRIQAAAGYGLYIASNTAVVASCDIRDGDTDAIAMEYAAVQVHNCNFVNNVGLGIRNTTTTSVSVTGNWWNSTGGPAGVGGAGMAGPLVASPWRTTPYVLPYLPSF
jgi:hypothetical protein